MIKQKLINFIRSSIKNPTIINIITVGVISILVKGVGFYKEVLVAGSFGLSELLDTFFIAVLLPGLISQVFLNSFNSVFIPNYILEKRTTKAPGNFQVTSITVTIIVALFFMLISYLFTEVYLETFFSGHNESYYNLVIIQFHYLLPCILFWGLTSWLSGLLNVYDEFRYTSIYPVLTSISMIIFLVFFKDIFKELVLVIGMLIGSITQFLFLLIVAFKKKILHRGRLDFANSNVVIMLKQVPAKIASSLISGVNPIVDQFFSAQLVIGSITALNYGIKIPLFIIGIIGVALGNVLLPYFSKSSVESKIETFNKLNKILKYILWACGAIVIVIIIFSTPIISVLFERGAFDNTDTLKVSKIQQMYALQIPFYIMGIVMVKYLTSINKNIFMVYASLLSLTLNIVLNSILIKYMEVYGLALSTSIVSIINTLVLYIFIRHLNKSYV